MSVFFMVLTPSRSRSFTTNSNSTSPIVPYKHAIRTGQGCKDGPNRLEYAIFLSQDAIMKPIIDLDKLTRLEKLQAMEQLWADLCRDEEELESPEWHREVLEQRERDLKDGKDTFVSLEEAKRILREERE